MLNPGENWKILTRRCAAEEGNMESRFQFLLQLFIVFTRADRAPSAVQLATMASSVFMLTLNDLGNIRRTQKVVELGDEIRRAVGLLPGVLLENVSSIGCMAVLATLLRYWVLLLLVLVVLTRMTVLSCYLQRQPRYRGIRFGDVIGRVSVGQIELNAKDILLSASWKITWLTLAMVLTALTITANVHPSLKMPGLAWEVSVNNLFSN